MIDRRVFVLALTGSALAWCGCGNLRHLDKGIDYVRELVRKFDCRDGQPAKVLIDPHCQDGICGVTCAPDRWKTP